MAIAVFLVTPMLLVIAAIWLLCRQEYKEVARRNPDWVYYED